MTNITSLFFDLFDSLLPVVLVLGDNMLQLVGQASKFSTLAITSCKLCFAILVLIYVSYLYFVKGETERSSNNLIDIVLCGVTILLLIVTNIIIIVKIKNEQDNAINAKTNELNEANSLH